MAVKEGNLEAPRRAPIPWESDAFSDPVEVDAELERVFDICHGCRRCVSLCNAFPTLFDLVDESDTMEVDGVAKEDYEKVVSLCYMCDLCAETKCPYLPPHEWAVDFPHLMLRAKARYLKEKKPKWRDRIITSTDPLFNVATLPGVSGIANTVFQSKPLRKVGEALFGIHSDAPIPRFNGKTAKRRLASSLSSFALAETASESMQMAAPERMAAPMLMSDSLEESTSTKQADIVSDQVAIFVTCYGDANSPQVVEDLAKILQFNDVEVAVIQDAHCCGMPKFELGDLQGVQHRKDQNIPVFLEYVDAGYQIMSVVPSCTLMYRQEIPLLFPDDDDVEDVAAAFVDPFEYLLNGTKQDRISTEFKIPLGNLTYHAACHQRVQNAGQNTRLFLELIPDTNVTMLERCSGHGGTHAIKKETYPGAMKIARPVTRRLQESNPDTFGSDCPIAGRLIAHGLDQELEVEHPLSMVRRAYGLS